MIKIQKKKDRWDNMIVLAVIREMLVQEKIHTNDENQACILLAQKYRIKVKDIRDFKVIA